MIIRSPPVWRTEEPDHRDQNHQQMVMTTFGHSDLKSCGYCGHLFSGGSA